MKKRRVAAVLAASMFIVAVGASIAYYNTKSFGFDEDAVILLQEEDGFTLFDYKVYYSDIEEFYNTSKEYMPDKAYSTDPHLATSLNDYINVINNIYSGVAGAEHKLYPQRSGSKTPA